MIAAQRCLMWGGLLAGLAVLAACLAPEPRFGPWSRDPPPAPEAQPIWRVAPRTEAPPAGSAWLTVESIAVSPRAVSPGQPFEIRLRVRNGGARVSGAFKVEVQANLVHTQLDAGVGFVSYPLASAERRELAPGVSAEFVFTPAGGLTSPGVYVIAAGIRVIDLAMVESTNFVDAEMPSVRLMVE